MNNERERLLAGAKMLNEKVSSTLGPHGKTVIIKKPGMLFPTITKDGATVANECYSNDTFEQTGIEISRQPALEMDQLYGDGTTGVTVVTNAIINAALGDKSFDVRIFKEESEIVKKKFFDYLDSIKKPVTVDDIFDIAMVPSNGDKEVSKLLHDLYSKIGIESKVNVIDAVDKKCSYNIQEGYVLEFGMVDIMYANTPSGTFVSKKCDVVILETDLYEKKEYLEFIDSYKNKDVDILIIARDFSYDVMALAKYFNQHNLNKICLVKNPKRVQENYGDYQDLSFLTGAEIASKLSFSYSPGRSNDVLVKAGLTIFKVEHNKETKYYIKSLEKASKKMIGFAQSEVIKRITKLKTGVISILVGAETDIEQKERKDRFNDAFNTVRNALTDGVVPGGGNAYLFFIDGYRDFINKLQSSAVFNEIFNAVTCKHIENWNSKIEVSSKIGEILSNKNAYFNFLTGEYEPIDEYKVIDPVNVIKKQFELSISVATTLLSTEHLIVKQ